MFPNLDFLHPLMIFIGIVAMLVFLNTRIKRLNLAETLVDRFLIILLLSGVTMLFSANLFNSLFHYLNNPSQGFHLKGITYMGGFIGGLFAFIILFWFIAKSERKNLLFYLNILVIGIVLAHAFGRIGCFLEGCCFGIETKAWFGVTYPKGSIASYQLTYVAEEGFSSLKSVKVIPTNLFEAIFLFGLFFVLTKVKKNQFVIYLICYGIWRFIIEFWRGDNRGSFIEPLSPSQFLSIIYIIIGLFIAGFQLYQKRRAKTIIKT